VRNLGDAPAAAIEAGQPYADLADFARRTSLPVPAMEALAPAGHDVIRRGRLTPPRLTPT
jgi:error-prone DNA polymerase